MAGGLQQLKEKVEQRLAAAAVEIFELLEKTFFKYEEETQRQKNLLEQLLQPRVQLQRTDLLQDKQVQHPEPPRVKKERDVISITLCSTEGTAPPPGHVPASEEVTAEHELLVPPAGGAVHTCSFCGKGYRWRHLLQRHLPVHTGEKRFHCLVCFKAFTRKDTMRIHMAVHSDSRPFRCSVCGKTMKTSRDLRRHVTTHHRYQKHQRNVFVREPENQASPPQTEDRPEDAPPLPPPGGARSVTRPKPEGRQRRVRLLQRFCLFCSKGFRYNSELLEHMRVHSGERPFSCSVCGKTFTTNQLLKRHTTLHQRPPIHPAPETTDPPCTRDHRSTLHQRPPIPTKLNIN